MQKRHDFRVIGEIVEAPDEDGKVDREFGIWSRDELMYQLF